MFRRELAICFAILFGGLTSDLSAQLPTQGQLPTARMLSRFGLTRAWWSQATMDIHRDHVRYLSLGEDNVYVQSSGGTVTAFDAATGQKRWARQLGRQDDPSYEAVANDDIVLVIAGLTIYALDKFDGNVEWTLLLQNAPSTSPAIDRDHVYLGTLDGSVFAYDLKKIRELHEEDRLPQWSGTALKWRYKSAKIITAPPVTNNLIVNFASQDNSLYSLTATERKLLWQFETDRPVSAPLGTGTIDEDVNHNGELDAGEDLNDDKKLDSFDVVFLASQDFNVFCINRLTGNILWQFVAGLPIRKAVRNIGDSVYIFPHGEGVFCVDKRTGVRQWWLPGMEDFVGATRSLAFLTDQTNNLVAVNRSSGYVVGSMPLKSFTIRYGNELTDRLFLATPSGLTVCIHEDGQEFPIFHAHPERQPILPEFAADNPEGDAEAPDAGAAADPNAAAAGF
ncbi:PQQ-binding-like beta-propeller repeat protein [bacterium]|nr:PQQ-binding-like beta-propeller repeat protein [bacterium]